MHNNKSHDNSGMGNNLNDLKYNPKLNNFNKSKSDRSSTQSGKQSVHRKRKSSKQTPLMFDPKDPIWLEIYRNIIIVTNAILLLSAIVLLSTESVSFPVFILIVAGVFLFHVTEMLTLNAVYNIHLIRKTSNQQNKLLKDISDSLTSNASNE